MAESYDSQELFPVTTTDPQTDLSESDFLSDGTTNFLQTQVGPDMANLVGELWSINGSQDYMNGGTVNPADIMPQTYGENTQMIQFVELPSTSAANIVQQNLLQQEELPNSQSSVSSDDGIPSVEPWPGAYNFTYCVEPGPTKKCSYSTKLNKLFCLNHMDIEFQFMYDFEKCKSQSMRIEAFLRYVKPSFASTPVRRCYIHLEEDRRKMIGKENKAELALIDHVLKCNHAKAVHFEDDYGRCRVRVPVGKPQPGSNYIPRNFRFDCLSSCKTALMENNVTQGNQKTPMMLVFELKENEKTRGRIVLNLRVCSCPARDFTKEENEYDRKQKGEDNKNRRTPKRKSATSTPPRVRDLLAGPSQGTAENQENQEEFENIAKYRRLSGITPVKTEPVTPPALVEDGDPFLTSSQESVLSDEEIQGSNKEMLRKKYRDYLNMTKYILKNYLKNTDNFSKQLSGQFARDIRRTFRNLEEYHRARRELAGGAGGSPDSGVGVNERPPRGE